jgi:aminoglycoside/choline kinase family phosphotransferase
MNPTLITWTDAQRQQNFTHWLNGIAARLGLQPETLRPASSDSSSRRYFRIDSDRGPLVVMDAPPALEDCASYVRFAQLLASAELHVPSIFDWNEAHGFMLLSDMGPTTYLDRMRERPQDIEALCDDASRALVRLQGITRQPWIPAYDTARLTMEIGMFSEWYVSGFFRLTLDARQQARVQSAFDHLVRNALSEPQIMVHRDFHNRNLMAATPNPGILDFQGAVWGGASYDLVSMLRCAYIEWDESFQQDQAHRPRQHPGNPGCPGWAWPP